MCDEKYDMEDMTSDEMFSIIRRNTDMAKIQVRRGIFETNSSSTHVISISKNDDKFMDNLPDKVYFGSGDFGWDWKILDNLQDKANYLFTAIVGNSESETYKPLITAILAKHGIEAEFGETKLSKNGYECFVYDRYAYVDHSYCAKDFIEGVCNSEEQLIAYLFSDTSYVATGNDNEYTPEDFYPNEGAIEIAEYEKGN